jgi:hypothetical protein
VKPKELKRWLSDIQDVFPTIFPVEVSVTSKLGPAHQDGNTAGCTWGTTVRAMRKGQPVLRILINKNLDPVAFYLVLQHEYAHAMSWMPLHMEEAQQFDHQPEWGICEARLWAHFSDLDHAEAMRPF